ncbi:glycoside hydrolase family 43 protein [Scatolibacter rhodanostii]|uniref:glycoside hydrolase family 43 protein n=1 Tax=Scatolibacter rhodanostii TaxID=2014781 RepID=UPI000C07E65A|nr:glycoside hydrolase 43 family protein [Scatolibacter rhodanostii]
MENQFITFADYPDPDVIRVEDTYYMVTTTMYFMPGCEIFRSYDLVNWEHACYVYETLDDTPAQMLDGEQNIYGQGMWAASLRYHKDTFYVCFVANDTHKTYLYTAKDITGPWRKQYIEGFYHDNSILFDDDRKVYIMYGNKDVYITELNSDLTAPKEGGFHQCILSDAEKVPLGYEGSHLYKINGKYVAMVCHMPVVNEARKVQSCFVSDSLSEPFSGGIVISDNRGFRNYGVAQGGLVDTPEGQWYSMLFQDVGAAGRIPVLCPVQWKNGFPVFGDYGFVPSQVVCESTHPDHAYAPLYNSDDFVYPPLGSKEICLKQGWQWNHNPNHDLWSITEKPNALRICTGKLCTNMTQAINTLTQRMLFPQCTATVHVDGSGLKNGDFAGFAALQGCYGMLAIEKQEEKFFLTLLTNPPQDKSIWGNKTKNQPGVVTERIEIDTPNVSMKITADFGETRDFARFYYHDREHWVPFGQPFELFFKLDHFTGCRFALSVFSTQQAGGYAEFSSFHYNPKE